MNPLNCDTNTGMCAIDTEIDEQAAVISPPDAELIYIGDPMCTWCWGFEPELTKFRIFSAEHGLGMCIVVGGLLPGGTPWTQQYREFLREHFTLINERTGQPFSLEIADRDDFLYDTEPACRSIVTARSFLKDRPTADAELAEFYAEVQRHWFADNVDPKQTEFYKPLCEVHEINFAEFIERWESAEMRRATQAEFNLSRQWGVRGFPTTVLRLDGELHLVANGYAPVEELIERLHDLVPGLV